MRNNTFLARLLLLTVFTLILVHPTLADDIPTVAAKYSQFSTLVKLLQAAGLVDALKQKGPFTIFAPNNDAFAKLPKEKVEELLRPENKTMLRKILLYHVVATKLTTAELAGASVGLKGPSLSGDDLTLTSLEPLRVNDATIIKTDIMADNGVIHVIDTVLMPNFAPISARPILGNVVTSNISPIIVPNPVTTPLGSTSITEVAAADPQFSTLVKLIKAAGFDETLAKRRPLTMFAPTNEAFNKLPPGTVDKLLMPENIAMLQSILEYHIVPGQYVAADAAGLAGQPISTALRGATLNLSMVGGPHINNASIVKTDVGANNGVVHVIDTVLMPPATTVKK